MKNLRLRRERSLEAVRGYLMLEMPDHALRELRSIEDPEKAPFAVHQLQGEALRQKGEHREALQAYNRALAERPRDLSVLLGMAWCYKRSEQLSKSIATMEEAYRASPREPIVLYNLACYFALAGDKPMALSWLGRALRMEQGLLKLIPNETDFDQLRDDPDFQYLVNTVERSKQS